MINNDIALRNVYDLLQVLDSLQITAWVQDGTLLGLVREGRTIGWDRDTDVGAYAAHWSNKAHLALEAAGFSLKGTIGTTTNGWQHRWMRDGIKTDIFFYYRNPDNTIWHAAYLRDEVQYRFTYPAFGLATLHTSAGPMLAPDPPEQFLEIKYGPDWRTPVRRWHFATSPFNGHKAV